MTNTPILQCLPLLADILGQRYGVVVEIGGDEAYTDGKTIRLPSLPMSDDPAFIGLVRGFIDHEAAHIRSTDSETMAALPLSPAERHVWNIFEDWRVEAELARIFPGCGENFRWLIRHLFLGRARNEPSLIPVLDWLLCAVRTWSVPELEPDRDHLAIRVDTLWPGIRSAVEAILATMRGHCPDSLACLDYARQVLALFRQQTESQAQSNQNNDPQSREGASTTTPCSLAEIVTATESQLPEGLGQALRRHLAEGIEAQQRISGPAVTVARVLPKPSIRLDPATKAAIRDTASGLKARLHGLLQASRLVRQIPSRRGRLDCHRLHGIAVGNPKLFLARRPKPVLDTAVHLLLDSSGSMKDRMALAGHCCLALAQTLNRSGISAGVTAFPGLEDPNGLPTVSPIIRHGNRTSGTGGMVPAKGGTPLAESVWWVLQRLAPRREARKILVIISDGKPDAVPEALTAITQAERLGVEVYGLGILSPEIETLLPNKSRSIASEAELPQAIFDLVGNRLLEGRQ